MKNEELGRPNLEEYQNIKKNHVTVVLDNIRSYNNVGSVFRTSDAFLIEKIYLCGITPCPPHKLIHKTALGATDSVKWEYVEKTEDVLTILKQQKYTIACIEQTEKHCDLQKINIKKNKWGVVFGNEVFGVQEKIIEQADEVIEIPQSGTKHSLNISVCAGIVLWEFYKSLYL